MSQPPKLLSAKAAKQKLEKLWLSCKLHQGWLTQQPQFPYRLHLSRPNDKALLHQFDDVRQWIADLSALFGERLRSQQVNYPSMGRQLIPVAIEFATIEDLARFLAKLGEWQQFCQVCRGINQDFPWLMDWLVQSPASIIQYLPQWPKLLAVCRYFQLNPQPNCYIRELDISGVDSKFVENHKKMLKTLLDVLLPASAINSDCDKLTEHGFERRFGLKFELPRVRLRLLDSSQWREFGGISDLELPIDQFAKLNIPCDRVFITENKTNGLAFPPLNNAIVIFGLGYGIQMIQNIHWLERCRIYYWGDIDTHGLAILSQARSYFPAIESFLMDQATLLNAKSMWVAEDPHKVCKADTLAELTATEQDLYHKLKTGFWQPNLRLEQERIPFGYWQAVLLGL